MEIKLNKRPILSPNYNLIRYFKLKKRLIFYTSKIINEKLVIVTNVNTYN